MTKNINTHLLVNVGYEYAFIPAEQLKGITLEEAGKVTIDSEEYIFFKAETFFESRKLDAIFDSGEIAPFRIKQ